MTRTCASWRPRTSSPHRSMRAGPPRPMSSQLLIHDCQCRDRYWSAASGVRMLCSCATGWLRVLRHPALFAKRGGAPSDGHTLERLYVFRVRRQAGKEPWLKLHWPPPPLRSCDVRFTRARAVSTASSRTSIRSMRNGRDKIHDQRIMPVLKMTSAGFRAQLNARAKGQPLNN